VCANFLLLGNSLYVLTDSRYFGLSGVKLRIYEKCYFEARTGDTIHNISDAERDTSGNMSTFEQPYVTCKQEKEIQEQCYGFGVSEQDVFGNSSMFKENNMYSLVGSSGQLPVFASKQVCIVYNL